MQNQGLRGFSTVNQGMEVAVKGRATTATVMLSYIGSLSWAPSGAQAIDYPVGSGVGDISIIAVNDWSATNTTFPSGYTVATAIQNSPGSFFNYAYKVLAASDIASPGSVNNFNVGSQTTIFSGVWRPIGTFSGLLVKKTVANQSGTSFHFSLSPAVGGSKGYIAVLASKAGQASFTPPPGFTSRGVFNPTLTCNICVADCSPASSSMSLSFSFPSSQPGGSGFILEAY
jgi:hypothetical protein